jgi:hypothetical protein
MLTQATAILPLLIDQQQANVSNSFTDMNYEKSKKLLMVITLALSTSLLITGCCLRRALVLCTAEKAKLYSLVLMSVQTY